VKYCPGKSWNDKIKWYQTQCCTVLLSTLIENLGRHLTQCCTALQCTLIDITMWATKEKVLFFI